MTPQKVLFIKLRAMGDTLIMLASIRALRQAHPDVEVHVAVPATWAPLLENHPDINRIWLVKNQNRIPLSVQLRLQRFDWIINLHASPSSARLARIAGGKERAVHFHGLEDPNRFSTVQVPGKGTVQPIIERDLDTLRGLGLQIEPHTFFPKVHLTETEIDQMKIRLQAEGIHFPLLAVGIGASRPTKQWPLENFANLALRWVQETHGSVYAVGSRSEADEVRFFMEKTLSPSIFGKTNFTLRELAALLHLATCFVGNDSGPKHLAVALDTHTVTLFGPEDPFEWHPYPQKNHPFHHISDLPCRRDAPAGFPPWCGLDKCLKENHRCMTDISPEAVLESVSRLCQNDQSQPPSSL